MASPLAVGLTVVAGLLGAGVAWVQRPRVPALDAERWFKAALCTLLRGDVEREGGDADAFEARVRREVPWHPAGRLPERKVTNPAAGLPGAALPGEAALVEALGRIPEAAARLRFLYDEDEAAIAPRLEDPAELGPDYDFTGAFGPAATWDALAAWPVDPAFGDALLRKLGVVVVAFEGRTPAFEGLLDAIVALVPGAVKVPWEERAPELAAGACRVALGDPDRRLVIVAEDTAVLQVLRGLAVAGDLRDRVFAVLSLAGAIGGRVGEDGDHGEVRARDWLGANFSHAVLETDVVRLTPYLALQAWDPDCWPPGVPGLPLAHQRFPAPAEDGSPALVEVHDLGPLLLGRTSPPDRVARALLAVTAAFAVSRRG